ncbi:hypothetical protein LIN78_04760 [Leeia sp. TBRC 13508]|uniref:Uncharacterized protein n=1 Tax=Leeia speluncae TaxID=2884804 RepID=A0ABS8D3T6_9NEIS|nr:hypothetical protein [Leeia speluncae]MCB6182860.1 hypothetical protein [Leeia speluncae]
MSENEAFGMYSKLYVLMRRVLTRSIDVQYLSQDKNYLAYVLKEALSAEDEDLQKLAAEIEAICFPKTENNVTAINEAREKRSAPEARYTGSLR